MYIQHYVVRVEQKIEKKTEIFIHVTTRKTFFFPCELKYTNNI